VAIEGFGKVGSALAGLLAQAGALVVAISTTEGAAYDPNGLDIPALQRMQAQAGSQLVRLVPKANQIDARELPGLPVDALCPCAIIHSIHEGNASGVRARILCPGANNPWTPAAESRLEASGGLLLPDFAANSGGVLGTLMAYCCFAPAEVASFIQEEFARSTRWLLERAQRHGLPLRAAGEELILLRRMPQPQERHQNYRPSILAAGLALHRRGLVPGPLVRSFARIYLRHKLSLPAEG